jgi:hypothetical protein
LKRRQEKEDVNNLIDFNRKISDQKWKQKIRWELKN